MDPLTHAVAGATIAWAASGRHVGRRALLLGAAAGLLPDVDVLIRSAADPLLAIEHHRGITHSIFVAPIGGAVAALPFLATGDRRDRWRYALAATLAYASHSLLDAATTYGTQLFQPLSRYRVGLDIISIIDPLFTLILLAGFVAAFFAKRPVVNAMLSLALVWLILGGVQRERALAAQVDLAALRGDHRTRGAVFPTIGNTIVWRSVYAAGGVLRMDRIRVPWLGAPSYARAGSVPIATLSDASTTPRITRDFERFAWFSDGWVARDPTDPSVIGDARYSLRAAAYEPVWGVRFDPRHDPPTEWVNRTRERDVRLADLWHELTGRNVELRPLR